VDKPPVEAEGVCVRYAHDNVVEDATFTIGAGEFVGIVGPNGGGKSTLLKALLGLVPVHCGAIRLWGDTPTEVRDRARIGYVPQHTMHADQRGFPATTFEVALLGRAPNRGLLRRFTAEDREAARAALRAVGMDQHADRRIGELSGGQRQRVFLAKALAGKPDLLLLDEPTTGVDPAARQSFLDLLDHLNHEDGVTVVLVSHDTPTLLLSAHRVLALNRRLVYDGPPAGLEAAGGHSLVYDLALSHAHGPEEGPHAPGP
jgi:zinc transport system ATP-binding protein